tara:strand:- start:594 stop:935 length:342 start_codon:yes stop_codon:yes gene_type:complete
LRCPACGWSNTLKNYPRKNAQLKKKLDDDVLESLTNNFLTILDPLTTYTLLKACTDAKVKVLRHSLNIWERRNLGDKGYDVYYFIGILRNEGKRYQDKRDKERERLEQLPPTQ